jgi:2Fe-2S ferredoxin
MAKVTITNPFENERHEVEVPAGTTLLEAAHKVHAKMGSNCGGVCACSTCHCYVKTGMDSLSEQEDREADRLDMGFDVKANSRLGCQSIIERANADIQIEITQESLQAFYDEHPDERRARDERLKAQQSNQTAAPASTPTPSSNP